MTSVEEVPVIHMIQNSELTPAQEQILNMIWEMSAEVKTHGNLHAAAGNFPSPAAGAVLEQALRYFALRKVKKDGSRDGARAAYNSRKLNFGRQAKSSTDINQVLTTPSGRSKSYFVALVFWLRKEAPKLFAYGEIQLLKHKSNFGIMNPIDLAEWFIFCIAWQDCGRERPGLPEKYR